MKRRNNKPQISNNRQASNNKIKSQKTLLNDITIDILNYMKQIKYKTKPPFAIEIEREEDGRWIAEVPKLPGVMAYGSTRQVALRKVYILALRMLADNVEQGQSAPVLSLFNYDVAHS